MRFLFDLYIIIYKSSSLKETRKETRVDDKDIVYKFVLNKKRINGKQCKHSYCWSRDSRLQPRISFNSAWL